MAGFLPSDCAVLLRHDGELDDVVALLEELEVAFDEHRGVRSVRDDEGPWHVLLATPQRMADFEGSAYQFDKREQKTLRIAIFDSYSRVLRNQLRLMQVDFMVQRPVHPEALRELILQSLYRGPERRRGARVSVGMPVEYRFRMRKRRATLTSLALNSCRILAKKGLKRGHQVQVCLPREIGLQKPLWVKGQVVRADAAPDGDPGLRSTAVVFGELSFRVRAELNKALEALKEGPAVLPKELEPARKQRKSAPPPPEEFAEQGSEATAETPPTPGDAADVEAGEGEERRGAPRHIFPRRVIALGDASPKILFGCDLSVSGMRTNPTPDLILGDRVRLAVHVREGDVPLVVDAQVTRDDGDRGLVLEFDEIAEDARHYLSEMLDLLPMQGSADSEEPVIVSEVLETDSRPDEDESSR